MQRRTRQSGHKLSKVSVRFEHPAKGPDHCSGCKHFLGRGVCEIVAGLIAPEDWCDKFRRKQKRK